MDEIQKQLTQIRLVLVKQEENLKEHMRRTELQETNAAKLWDALQAFKLSVDETSNQSRQAMQIFKDSVEAKLIPIQKLVDRVQFIFAVLGVAGTIAGIVEAVSTAYTALHGGGGK